MLNPIKNHKCIIKNLLDLVPWFSRFPLRNVPVGHKGWSRGQYVAGGPGFGGCIGTEGSGPEPFI